ncbi:MAG: GNAT family N-acetyltransferase [Gammaproteobacteria bacterium]|nr:GNAT family N-acetyltransferase [Gammaproteobacteria bacterium]MBU1819377.1 GNAT family N-acetyltransferase [Gammaproteobacteria bacterium]
MRGYSRRWLCAAAHCIPLGPLHRLRQKHSQPNWRSWSPLPTKLFSSACLPGAAVADRGGEQIAGAIHLSQMVMGNFRSAYLGYYVFAGYERRGVMRLGLQQVVRHAFAHLNLHRLEANIQPGNTASIALVRACGFTQEGFSPRYLRINGRWRDHERWAIEAS